MATQQPTIDGRSLAIGVLGITACILFVGFLLVTTMTTPAHAIGMNDSAGDYKIATQQLTTSNEGVVVVDAAAKRLIVYSFDYNRKQLVPLSSVELSLLQAPAPDQPGGRQP